MEVQHPILLFVDKIQKTTGLLQRLFGQSCAIQFGSGLLLEAVRAGISFTRATPQPCPLCSGTYFAYLLTKANVKHHSFLSESDLKGLLLDVCWVGSSCTRDSYAWTPNFFCTFFPGLRIYYYLAPKGHLLFCTFFPGLRI